MSMLDLKLKIVFKFNSELELPSLKNFESSIFINLVKMSKSNNASQRSMKSQNGF